VFTPCTVISVAQLAHARVLAAALERRAPGARLVALVLDDVGRTSGGEPFEILKATELPEFDRLGLYALKPEYLAERVKPWLVRRLLERGEPVLLLEPELDLHAPLGDLEALAREHGVVLAPRLLGPLADDGAHPNELEVQHGGLYRSGLLAVAAGERGRAFADWWARQDLLLPEDEAYADDAPLGWPIDLAPALFDEIAILRDPGHGVAYWNLGQRPLGRDSGGLTAGGVRLRSLYLPGFDPRRPHWLSDENTRIQVTSDELLSELLEAFAARLLAAGHAQEPWGYDTLGNGVELDDELRSLLVAVDQAGVDIGDPFSEAGGERFIEWVKGPGERGAAAGVSRYLLAYYLRRPDLRETMPALDAGDGERLIQWAHERGVKEGLQPALLPPLPAAPEATATTKPRLGVNVAGYLSGGLGLGEAARLYVSALEAAGVPLTTESVDPPLPPTQRAFGVHASRKQLSYAGVDNPVEHPLNLVCVNAPELPEFAKRVGPEFFRHRKTIGVWGWETSFIPDDWDAAFGFVDEIWTYTTYVASVLARRAPVPVVAVPLPIQRPQQIDPQLELDLPDAFTFVFAFDFFSTIQRKNPLGLIEAFKRAFEPGEGPQLVLKSFNGDYKPEHLERVRHAARRRPDIHIVDRFFTVGQRNALMARADCYVSLHRSEGFGLTLAEAMILGKPVIATGYSGNLDFMGPHDAYLVDYELTEVGPGVEIYPSEGVWADPDLDQAAAYMRRVVERPEEAAAVAERGRARVAAQLSPAACGAIARRRLEGLLGREAAERERAATTATPALDAFRAAVTWDPAAQGSGSHPKQLARRAALNAMRPYTGYRSDVDRRLLGALDEMFERTVGFDERALSLGRRALRAEWHARRLEQRLDELEATVAAGEERWRSMGDDLGRLAEAARVRPASGHPALRGPDDTLAFGDWNRSGADGYAGFEDIFRGSEQEIAARVAEYVPLLREHAPVLDAGCGRGELLAALADAGIEARGVDSDETVLARAREQGLAVERGDAVEHLAGLAAGALGAVTALQLVEHLAYADLVAFLTAARAALAPGGLLVAETVNPHAPAALKAFWTDPSHRHPLPPETLLALTRLAGFSSGRVHFPGGSGEFEADVYSCPDYAVVAEA
jgi:glycosyltransferase involved in cell wall biosynthesis/2-polyprenyl-3-methyl-5-hydroxy-6-metoxy-1,4-benzoquinol methylase